MAASCSVRCWRLEGHPCVLEAEGELTYWLSRASRQHPVPPGMCL